MRKVITNQNSSLITDTYTHVQGRTILNITLKDEQISGGKFDRIIFENIIFYNCNIQASSFTETNFVECEFINCNFSFTKFKSCTLVACVFESCNFCITNSLNTDFQTCTFQSNSWKLGVFRDNNIKDCILDYQTEEHITKNGENINYLSTLKDTPPAIFEQTMAA